ncbi:MAG: hypothetical protein K2Q22_06700 [Cytophagales bacterium]|nr:hypothetical protein [Cytophagales bacterium]
MYLNLLVFHSLLRWVVLASLIIAIVRSYQGWFGKKEFTKADNSLRILTSTVAHIQLTVGLWLYFISPIIQYFIDNFSVAVKQRDIRFFGMEHSIMMIFAIVALTIGSAASKRKELDVDKFRTMAIWFSVGLLIILVSIPWPFSSFTAQRPLWRGF